jgi:predicted transcriptional regulator
MKQPVSSSNLERSSLQAMTVREVAAQKEIAVRNEKRMTVREVALQLSCNPETVRGHIRELFPGLMRNGKTTYLDEKQVTIILEKMKMPVSSGTVANLQSQIAGTETALSPALKLEMLYRQIDEIKTAEITRLNAELSATTRLLDARTAGLATIQRIAEAGGLITSDRDDIEATYRR